MFLSENKRVVTLAYVDGPYTATNAKGPDIGFDNASSETTLLSITETANTLFTLT